MSTLSKLIEGLKELAQLPAENLIPDDTCKEIMHFDNNNPKIADIGMYASDIFCNGTGDVWYYNAILSDMQYVVYATERDDYGWVAGRISIQNPDERFERILSFCSM